MRPWVVRALVMAAVYGVAQAAFVAARSWEPDSTTLWSVLILALVLAVGVGWAGSEVVLGRRPEEWTWFRAALAAAPTAGLLSWILLALFVDGTGVADLGPALVGRATFTALLVLASATVGSRLGWLALRRRGEGDDDPALDRDETDPAALRAARASARRSLGARSADGAPVLDRGTTTKVARLRGRPEPEPVPDHVPDPVPEPAAGDVAGSTSDGPAELDDTAPRGAAPDGAAPDEVPEDTAAPVVAVLPESSYVASTPSPTPAAADEEPEARPPRRRGRGLRRPT